MDGTMDHRIDLGDFSSTDHIVEGTEGDDHLERYAYRGDPTLDMVDNGDAADGSDDDVIRALGGDDFITSSAGSDSIDGGEGTDTYAARSLDIYRFSGTEFLGHLIPAVPAMSMATGWVTYSSGTPMPGRPI
ncbi:MAG: hypothetical protein JKP98_26865 [Rhodobacteraceae bacterium]|nr:hypothetical protein [Paracoccaceae bacterium]